MFSPAAMCAKPLFLSFAGSIKNHENTNTYTATRQCLRKTNWKFVFVGEKRHDCPAGYHRTWWVDRIANSERFVAGVYHFDAAAIAELDDIQLVNNHAMFHAREAYVL